MRTLALLVIGLGLMAQAEAGTDLVESCAVCHGPDGVIANALYDYRGHSRPCRKGACAADGSCPDVDMCELARPLTDGEMDILARYYSARPFSPSVADYDESKAAAGSGIHQQYCETCHSGGGSNPQDEASILRGQNMEYVRNALRDYRSGDIITGPAGQKSAETDDRTECVRHSHRRWQKTRGHSDTQGPEVSQRL